MEFQLSYFSCLKMMMIKCCTQYAIKFGISAMATGLEGQFSEFASILSAALSQHHLLGFEIAQLEFHHLH